VAASVVAVCLILGLTTAGGGAGAQSIETLRDKAARVAAELERLQNRSDELNEQYLQTQEDVATLEAEQQANAAAVTAAETQLAQTRAEASGYLVQAYVGAGAHDQIAFGNADPNQAVSQKVLLEVLKGDRVKISDGIVADKADLESKSSQLERSSAQLAQRQTEQAEIVEQLEASVGEQQQLLNSTKGELDAAVKAEQQRQAAEAAARAAEAARRQAEQAAAAQAAASAAAQARAQTATTRAPRASATPAAPAAPRAEAPPAPAEQAPLPASGPNSGASGAIAAAQSRLGTPYRYGGSTPAGFDCSGLMLWSWAQVGVSLPRTSGAQRSATQRITRDQLQPGDLVFYGNPVSHVGMYVGGGQMIHSPHTGDVVKISPIDRMGGKAMSFGRIG